MERKRNGGMDREGMIQKEKKAIESVSFYT